MQPTVHAQPPRARAPAPPFRDAVVDALQTLGQGFLDHPANSRLRDRLRTGALPVQAFHDQLLITALRLAFLHLAQRPTDDRPPLLPALPAPTSDHWRRFAETARALAGPRASRGLPALGGFLWRRDAAPDLLPAAGADRRAPQLADAAFLHASHALARIRSADDLAVYEALLALKPQLAPDGRFDYAHAPAAARKAAGAYYTPDALVQSLLDSALDPVVAQAVAGAPGAAPAAILALRVCDPACGTGRFLVAAARRLALHLARARGSPDDPAARRRALHDVLGRCIHGVDLDPLAVELCKISLWLELARPREPLTFLDDRIKRGNALVGADPDLLAAGIPDEAFTTLPGDHPKAVAFFKRRNKLERAADPARTPRRTASRVDDAALALDAWCAAFLWRKHDVDTPGAVAGLPGAWDAVTHRTLRRLGQRPASVPARLRAEVRRLADLHGFFHWPLAFPEVFARRKARPGGFDVVLGNPPFLNQLETATATARGLAALLAARFAGVSRGYTDLSATFLLLAARLARPGGRVALVQPHSLLAAKDAAPVRRAVLSAGSLSALWVANAYLFPGASVFTCAPTIHIAGPRSAPLARSTGPAFTPLPAIHLHADDLAREETWAHLIAAGVPDLEPRTAGRLADLAHATADFRDQYYGLDGFLVEDADLEPARRDDDRFPPIVTSGLIDPARCRWGQDPTRILKRRWLAPRVDRGRMLASGTLGPWLAARLVPKLLLATQTRTLEVFVDETGRFVPSTPLITITPRPTDPTDPAALWRLAAALASPVLSALALRKFAGAALNADAIKLSARQVLDLPLPAHRDAWDQAARRFRDASFADDPRERARALHDAARLSCRAYALAEPDVDALMTWWTERLQSRSPANIVIRRAPLGPDLSQAFRIPEPNRAPPGL